MNTRIDQFFNNGEYYTDKESMDLCESNGFYECKKKSGACRTFITFKISLI